MPVFLDTNVFLYAGSRAEADQEKRRVAERLILSEEFAVSSQVLQEFIANALRKPELGFSEEDITRVILGFEELKVLPVSWELVTEAWVLRQAHQLSHWDSTILAAAIELGCETLYSEDFGDGRSYGPVRVVNPFA